MAPAPLLVFPCVDHVDRLQLDSAPAEVEFRRCSWTVVIGINSFLTWVDIFRAAHARRPYHLVTYMYLHQLTIPSSGLVSPQVSSLHRLAWLALAAAGTPAVCAIQMHLLLMVSSMLGLECAWTWLPRSQRAALSYFRGVPELPPAAHGSWREPMA